MLLYDIHAIVDNIISIHENIKAGQYHEVNTWLLVDCMEKIIPSGLKTVEGILHRSLLSTCVNLFSIIILCIQLGSQCT